MNMEAKIMFSIWLCLLTLKIEYTEEIKAITNYLLPSKSNFIKKVIFYFLNNAILEYYFFLRLTEKFILIYFILILGSTLIIRTIAWVYKKIRNIYNKKS